ncbi:putative GTP-binding protein [Escherichia coli B574]|nr:GTPase domain protein [Escherichia coli P0304799.3]OSK24627.1 putative GTP-binding protein [Escherichia coli B574]
MADRVLAVDEHFYRRVIGEAYQHKVLFVISQSDKVEPTVTNSAKVALPQLG